MIDDYYRRKIASPFGPTPSILSRAQGDDYGPIIDVAIAAEKLADVLDKLHPEATTFVLDNAAVVTINP